jgi:hypothetical protein
MPCSGVVKHLSCVSSCFITEFQNGYDMVLHAAFAIKYKDLKVKVSQGKVSYWRIVWPWGQSLSVG